MKITHHGGKCCAIKHIHGLYDGPDCPVVDAYDIDDLAGFGVEYLRRDRQGETVNSDANIYTGDVEEFYDLTMGELFDTYLRFLMKVRPYGLVEATIVPTHGEAVRVEGSSARESEAGTTEDLLPVFDEDSEEVQHRPDTVASNIYRQWASFLEARGFRCVSKVPNTNSGNIVHVYHLVMDGDWHKKVGKAGNLDCFDVKKKEK